ncbi:MAG: hypothetical protein AB4426_29300 [Xenococcaceae cyanobacterium]
MLIYHNYSGRAIKVNCEDKATVRPASTLEAGRNRQQEIGNIDI